MATLIDENVFAAKRSPSAVKPMVQPTMITPIPGDAGSLASASNTETAACRANGLAKPEGLTA
jgi:hypothetical protein